MEPLNTLVRPFIVMGILEDVVGVPETVEEPEAAPFTNTRIVVPSNETARWFHELAVITVAPDEGTFIPVLV